MTILTTMACTLSAAGISKPAFSDVLETMQARIQAIYGADAYIEPDSQDGQVIAAVVKAIDDTNDLAVGVYNSFSPATAQGRALSNNVKINGIARAVPTNSSVTLRVSGTAGTIIASGIATDSAGTRWLLPASVTIPPAGFIDVTATSEAPGAVTALAGTITGIDTPTLGWQSVTNPAAAAAGAPIESDATLRARQAVSVAMPSKTTRGALLGALSSLTGVTAVEVYENDTDTTDANGIPSHSIAAVVQGGTNADIADAICRKKGPGCGTDGTTSLSVSNPQGVATLIKWYAPTQQRVIAGITIKALDGYLSTTGDALKDAVAAFVSGLGIGNPVLLGRVYIPAQLSFGPGYEQYELQSVQLALYGNTLAAADVAIDFNAIANLTVADITLTVT